MVPVIDVFISHASPDKEHYARPLHEALRRRMVSAWIDEAQIQPGDSLVESIGRGLAQARYVVLLLSDAFLQRQWTSKELGVALNRHIGSSDTVVIPVAIADRERVFARYPLLQDLLCPSWDESGADGIAASISRRLRREPDRWWTHTYNETHTGDVWVRMQGSETPREPVEVTLMWGPIRYTALFDLGPEPLSLRTQKLHADAEPLYVVADSPVVVTFGEGPAPDPDERVRAIDEGWVRVSGAPVTRLH
ncbi:hypothetical protein DQ237_10875 [Blastococcus sp. TF02-8]|uniref:toll/interleukin-1 receptor domain-containing protein n=1 Tax=Blastococcus sp. TF02-8 TaxID=2250574 RepID=UPI000DEA0FF5|nr:toll/interleukin-1 receptor domain-containing protein [Blastococcus sp. TF02-8]RBY96343.1 hypothetical protein DQ237_10875 [Blastococcus sp. TF02-8]